MISIIIPVYNEADGIVNTISRLQEWCVAYQAELIVVDGGSTDGTVALARVAGAKAVTGPKGRARQMNHGASIATGEILYFLHADSLPPPDFAAQILGAWQKGAKSGCFRLRFDHDHWFLKTNAWFTRFDINGLRFGDQSLFVERSIFHKSGGFNEELLIMEDQEIIHRLKRYGGFTVLNDYVTTSARKYLDNGIYKMQGIFYLIWTLYYLGYAQESLLRIYKRMIRKHKL